MKSCKVLISPYQDPYINLAIEDKLLRSTYDGHILFFYTNSKSLIMGHFQDPWREVNFPLLNRLGIPLVRRQSGGGTIFSDSASLNYSFIAPKAIFNTETHYKIFESVFEELGTKITKDKYYSLFLNGFKFSGAAFKNIKERSLHHGTLLIDGDEDFIHQLLTPSVDILDSRSTDSNPAKIKTLVKNGLSADKEFWIQQIMLSFFNIYGVDSSEVNLEEVGDYDTTEEQRLRSWKWIYGMTPYSKFTIENNIIVAKKGMIVEVNDHACNIDLNFLLNENNNKNTLSYDRAHISELEKLLDYFLLR